MNDDKVGNFTNGGSDTKGAGMVPKGSDTKEFYAQGTAPEVYGKTPKAGPATPNNVNLSNKSVGNGKPANQR